MVQTFSLGEIRQAAANQRRRGLGERAGPIGYAELIGDNGELVALRSQSPDRQQKVAAVQSVYPARAQRYVRAIHGGDRPFPVQLTLAIHAERSGRRVFGVRSRSHAVEYFVG